MRTHCQFHLAAALAVCCAGSGAASTICVSGSSPGNPCSTPMVPFAPAFFDVTANLFGDAAVAGITAAEFRITGIGPDWFITSMPNPLSCIVLNPGNVFDCGGVICFQTCQTGPVPLLRFSALPLGPVSGRVLRVEQPICTPPFGPNFGCPVLILCDVPFVTRLCVPFCSTCVNLDPCPECGPLGVEAETWSSVKAMYRE